MLKIKHLILILLCGIFLTSCSSSERTSAQPEPSSLGSNSAVPTSSPKDAAVNQEPAEATLSPNQDIIEDQLIGLIQNLLQTPEALTGGDLLVDGIKNKSVRDIALPDKFDRNLIELLSINSHFTIVAQDKVEQAAQLLGLDSDIVNNSSMKAIALARYLQTQYVLYTNINESNQQLRLTMQLLMVKSGEIIWQDSASIPLAQLEPSPEPSVN